MGQNLRQSSDMLHTVRPPVASDVVPSKVSFLLSILRQCFLLLLIHFQYAAGGGGLGGGGFASLPQGNKPILMLNSTEH